MYYYLFLHIIITVRRRSKHTMSSCSSMACTSKRLRGNSLPQNSCRKLAFFGQGSPAHCACQTVPRLCLPSPATATPSSQCCCCPLLKDGGDLTPPQSTGPLAQILQRMPRQQPLSRSLPCFRSAHHLSARREDCDQSLHRHHQFSLLHGYTFKHSILWFTCTGDTTFYIQKNLQLCDQEGTNAVPLGVSIMCSILTLLRIITYYNTLYCIITVEKAQYS